MVQATSCGQLFSIRRQEHFFCCFGENISQLVSNQEAIFHSWPGQKKSRDILKLVIAQRELAWQWDLFDFRILQDCKVCCAVLNHRLVGCIVQHILREELTKLLPSKTPPCNARNPRSSSQRLFLFILISTCCTWVCLASKEHLAASLYPPHCRTRKNSTSSWSRSTPGDKPIFHTKC